MASSTVACSLFNSSWSSSQCYWHEGFHDVSWPMLNGKTVIWRKSHSRRERYRLILFTTKCTTAHQSTRSPNPTTSSLLHLWSPMNSTPAISQMLLKFIMVFLSPLALNHSNCACWLNINFSRSRSSSLAEQVPSHEYYPPNTAVEHSEETLHPMLPPDASPSDRPARPNDFRHKLHSTNGSSD